MRNIKVCTVAKTAIIEWRQTNCNIMGLTLGSCLNSLPHCRAQSMTKKGRGIFVWALLWCL